MKELKGPNEIKQQGFDPALVDRILRMVNINEYKRNQFCPMIRISPKAFGVGRRLPIVANLFELKFNFWKVLRTFQKFLK